MEASTDFFERKEGKGGNIIMNKDYTDTFILKSLKLPIIKDIQDLSNEVSLSKRIIYLLSKCNQNFYKRFYIDKKDGTKREILNPSYSMKMLQRWILENILYKVLVSEASVAYKKGSGHSTKKNAELHKKSLYIMKLDISNFFHSISRQRVYYLFKRIGYNKLISNTFANICTYKDYLPQGAVTSAYLSNIICYKLDRRLLGFCGRRDIIYSRYADDLTFSCDNKDILKKLKAVIYEIIIDEGFEINEKKTRFLSPKSRKRITGITVNNGNLKAPKEMKKKVRAMIHHAIVSKNYSQLNSVKGYIAYINSIEKGYNDKIKKYINRFQSSDLMYFDDIIDQYNQNKIYKDLNDFEKRKPRFTEWFGYYETEDEYLSDIYFERVDFLKEKYEGHRD